MQAESRHSVVMACGQPDWKVEMSAGAVSQGQLEMGAVSVRY